MASRRAQLAVAAVALAAVPAGEAAGRALPRVVTLQSAAGVVPGMTPELDTGGLEGYALFVEGRFGAVFLVRGVRTPAGIHVGSSVADLRRAYGARLRSEPHFSVPGGHYFSLVQRSPARRIRFDSDAAGRITQVAFGGNAARYIEGCA